MLQKSVLVSGRVEENVVILENIKKMRRFSIGCLFVQIESLSVALNWLKYDFVRVFSKSTEMFL